jgi:hypothetical protein
MNTTLKCLSPGEAVKAFIASKVGPFADMRQAIPFAPLTSGVADAAGNVTLDLPARTEIVVQRADGRVIRVQNGITWKGSS